jgi:DNA polymerase-3 subunit alpha
VQSVNHSGVDFLPENGAIRYSLAALKNIGSGAVQSIVEERERGGPFKSLADFAERFDAKMLNKRAVETLAAAGAFDDLEPRRARVYANIEPLLAYAGRVADDRASGQCDLFGGGGAGGGAGGATTLQLRNAPDWDLMETLSHELDAIGFYLSGHPLDSYTEALERMGIMRWSELDAKVRDQGSVDARVAATVTYKQERKSKSGNRFAFGGFSDPTGQFEAVIFSDTLSLAGDALEPGKAVLLNVEAELDGENVKARVRAAQDLDAALGRTRSCFSIVADGRFSVADLAKNVGRDGSVSLMLHLRLSDAGREVEIFLGKNFDITPRQAGSLKALPGVLEVVSS